MNTRPRADGAVCPFVIVVVVDGGSSSSTATTTVFLRDKIRWFIGLSLSQATPYTICLSVCLFALLVQRREEKKRIQNTLVVSHTLYALLHDVCYGLRLTPTAYAMPRCLGPYKPRDSARSALLTAVRSRRRRALPCSPARVLHGPAAPVSLSFLCSIERDKR